NFPVLSTVTTGGGTTTVTGTLKASPNSTYRIEFFANDTDPLPLPAEGQEFLGSMNVLTDASGTATINTVLAGAVANGRIITATATDAIGNTSEFSAGVPVPTTPPATLTVTSLTDELDALGSENGQLSLREAIMSVNNQADFNADVTKHRVGAYGGTTTIVFNIPGGGVRTILIGNDASAPGIPLPTIVKPVTINGSHNSQ